jgi:hypothetical protein
MLHNITNTPDCAQYKRYWFTLCTTNMLQELVILSSLNYGPWGKGEEGGVGGLGKL